MIDVKEGAEAHWMCTASGEVFYPLKPELGGIKLDDIAHALSNICRWTGHTRVHYSVANHSVHVANLLLQFGYSNRVALLGLLHDSPESMINDIARPLKKSIGGIERVEARIFAEILKVLNVKPPTKLEWEQVKRADNFSLEIEAFQLMPEIVWSQISSEEAKTAPPLPMPRNPKAYFLQAYARLTAGIDCPATPVFGG